MARSDLLINLVSAATRGDRVLFRRTLEALIAEERQKQHHVLADRLAEFLQNDGKSESISFERRGPANGTDRIHEFVYELYPQRKLEDLLLSDVVLTACRELIEEQLRADLLRSYNLEPRNRVLLAGPPGNGKTSLAEAIAEALMVPLFVVRYEGVIGSYLGETSARLRKVFDHVRTRRCVLFFDEFDTIGKERGDLQETGEIKRVVSALLLQIDTLPSHVVTVAATNHPELLDRAVWRRFQLRLSLPAPTRAQREEWFRRFEKRLGEPLGFSPRTLADKLARLSFAEMEEFCGDVLRRRVLTGPGTPMKEIVARCLAQWQARYHPSEGEGER